MINGVGNRNLSRLELSSGSVDRNVAAAKADETSSQEAVRAPMTASAEMAAAGAPVDMDKIAAIKAAIAEGRYPVDPDKIAEKMIDLDLPGRFAE